MHVVGQMPFCVHYAVPITANKKFYFWMCFRLQFGNTELFSDYIYHYIDNAKLFETLLRQFVLYYPEEESYSGLRSAKLGLSFKVKFDYHAKIVCSAFFYYPLQCLSDNMTT